MARAQLLLSAILLSAALLFPSAQPAVGAEAGASGEPVGELVERIGAVAVLRDVGSGPLQPGEPIFEGDLIVTGADARARLRFSDGTVLSIGSDSQLSVVDYLQPEESSGRRGLLSLVIGILRAVVAPNDQRRGLDIETRVAVASVRSTDLMVEAAAKGTAVVTLEGEVAVASKAPGPIETVVLTDGMGTDVPPEGPPSPPTRWRERRVVDFIERTRVP